MRWFIFWATWYIFSAYAIEFYYQDKYELDQYQKMYEYNSPGFQITVQENKPERQITYDSLNSFITNGCEPCE